MDIPRMMVMTSPKTEWTLGGFTWLLGRYVNELPMIHVFGFDESGDDVVSLGNHNSFTFHSFGRFRDFPRERWSDTFLMAMDVMEIFGETFWFMMDDYWLVRSVDVNAVISLNSYMIGEGDILKVDLATDRLYAKRGEPYLYGKGTVARVGHLDIIQSDPNTDYHMSLWSGLWNISLLRSVIVPGESAQEIEINGTARLGAMPHLRVVGTRQAPVLHTNIIRGGGDPIYTGYNIDGDDVNPVHPIDLAAMKLDGAEVR